MMSSSRNDNATCADSGEKRKHQEMKQQSSSNDGSALHTLFEKAQDRLKAAQVELDLAEQNMERIRWQIRASGNYTEPDSLLCLCDGEGHLLAHVINFLETDDLGRCAAVCHTLKNQADRCWGTFETRLLTHPSLRSPSAHSSMERVARYMKASDFASRIGAMGDNISKHFCYTFTTPPERVHDHCTGCDFPDMNLDYLYYDSSDEYELFARLSRTSNNELLAEGFAPRESGGEMLLEGLDFSKWPEVLEINRQIDLLGYNFGFEEGEFEGRHYRERGGENVELLDRIMGDLTVVVVAVNKISSEVCLVAANHDFSDDIDIQVGAGCYGSCTSHNGLLSRSHGSFDENEDRKKLEVAFSTRTYMVEGVERTECSWSLMLEKEE